MRGMIVGILAVVAALTAANMLGVASAEAPTTTSVRTVSVEGVASVPISQSANREEAIAAYRLGMASALADGQSKAEFLAGKAGGTLGAVQSIAERGGSISCSQGENAEGYAAYAPYNGERPDFGDEEEAAVVRAAKAVAPAAKPKSKKKQKPTAKKASAVACTLSAQVGIVDVLQ